MEDLLSHSSSLVHTHEITSIDSLNLALKAKTKATKAIWWSVSVVILVSAIVATVALVQKYQDDSTVVRIKVNFCF